MCSIKGRFDNFSCVGFMRGRLYSQQIRVRVRTQQTLHQIMGHKSHNCGTTYLPGQNGCWMSEFLLGMHVQVVQGQNGQEGHDTPAFLFFSTK